MHRLCLVVALAIGTTWGLASMPVQAAGPPEQAFVLNNVRFVAAPPGDFIPNAAGRQVPAGHLSWSLVIDTTGLPDDQPLATIIVQDHYTNVQLGVTGLPDQGQLTNADGTITHITGGLFTGWIDDCAAPLRTTFVNKQGQTIHEATLGCTLNRIQNAYPDNVRLLSMDSPGYPSVQSATMTMI